MLNHWYPDSKPSRWEVRRNPFLAQPQPQTPRQLRKNEVSYIALLQLAVTLISAEEMAAKIEAMVKPILHTASI
jgi:hypothetical protein